MSDPVIPLAWVEAAHLRWHEWNDPGEGAEPRPDRRAGRERKDKEGDARE